MATSNADIFMKYGLTANGEKQAATNSPPASASAPKLNKNAAIYAKYGLTSGGEKPSASSNSYAYDRQEESVAQAQASHNAAKAAKTTQQAPAVVPQTGAQQFYGWAMKPEPSKAVSDINGTIAGGTLKGAAGVVGALGTVANAVDKEILRGVSPTNPSYAATMADADRVGLNKAADRLNATYENLNSKGEARIAQAKEGKGNVEKFLIDLGVNGVQLLGDAAANAVIPGAGLVSMGTRAFGDASQTARKNGARPIDQVTYGGAVAAVEVLTERMFDGLAGVYGEGGADRIVDSVIRRYAKTPGAANALRMLASAGGESVEELVSGVIDPALESIYNGKRIGQNYDENTVADVLYSMLIGGALGTAGGTVDVMRGRDARQSVETPAPVNAGARQTSAEGNLTPAANGANLTAKNAPQSAQTQTAQIARRDAATQATLDAALAATDEAQAEARKARADALAAEHEANRQKIIDIFANTLVGKDANKNAASVSETAMDGDRPAHGASLAETQIDPRTQPLGETPTRDANIVPDAETLVNEKSAEKFMKEHGDAAYTEAFVAAMNRGDIKENAVGQYSVAKAEEHIDNRTDRSVGARSVKPFQYLNPEVHPYYKSVAEILLDELNDAEKGGQIVPYNELVSEDSEIYDTKYKRTKRQATEAISDLLDNNRGISYKQLQKALEDIVADKEHDNYALAKRVELEIDSLLENDYFVQREQQPLSRLVDIEAYRAAKDAIRGAEARTEHVDMLADIDDIPGMAETTEGAEQKGDYGSATGAASQGFSVPHSGEFVPTQNRTTTQSRYMTPEESADVRPQDHERISEGQSVQRAAQQFYSDSEGNVTNLEDTIETLLEKETWTGADQDAAQLAQVQLVNRAREYAQEHNGEHSPEIRAQIQQLARAIDEHGTEAGRSLQARKKWVNTPGDIISRASQILDNAREGTDVQEVLDTISDMATDMEDAIEAEDWDALGDLIRRTSRIRRTGNFFTNRWSRTMNNALDHVIEQAADGDATAREFLQNHVASGLVAIAHDHTPVNAANSLLAIRRNAMLSRASTTMRNLVSNNVFDPIDSVSNDISVPLDILLSRITGTRGVPIDRSWLSEQKRTGSRDALERSVLEVGLDVDATGDRSRYETGSSRTHKMAGGTVSRLLSTWEKHLGYLLNSSDQFQKGGITAEYQRGIDELYARGLITDRSLENAGATEALYRTFQDETALSQLSIDARRALNRINAGGVGLGDFAVPFAQVPANLASRALEYSPVGIARGVAQIGQVLAAAHNGTLTAAQQAQAVKSFGRGLNGTALIAAATALAIKGILRVEGTGGDDEDKDRKALNKAAGLKGTQINLSALERWTRGESTEWRDGDLLHSIGFLDPLNAQLTTGALIAQDYATDDATPSALLQDTLEGTIQSVLDIPVMNTFKDVADAYHYSTAATEGGKIIDAGMRFVSSNATSVIPNSLRGVAAGFDEYQRDQTSGDTVAKQTWDAIKASVPGLRETLPEKLDNYGNPIRNDDRLLNLVNTNLAPGAWNRYQRPQAEVTQELERIGDATGDNGVFPNRAAPNSIAVDGEKHELTAEEKREFQRTAGREFLDLASAIIDGQKYDHLTDEQKADAISGMVAYANARARQDFVESKGGEYKMSGEARTVEKAVEAGKAGIDPSEYFVLKVVHDKIGDSDGTAQEKATRFASYLNGVSWLTDAQRETAKDLLTYSSGFRAEANDKALAAEESGIPLDVWNDYHRAVGSIKADKDESGKTVAGSKKAKVVDYIAGMNITAEQKDQLYLENGYSEKGLAETPWHK